MPGLDQQFWRDDVTIFKALQRAQVDNRVPPFCLARVMPTLWPGVPRIWQGRRRWVGVLAAFKARSCPTTRFVALVSPCRKSYRCRIQSRVRCASDDA